MARLVGVVVVLTLMATACGPGGGIGSEAGPDPVLLDQVTSSPKQDVTSALGDPSAAGLPRPLVDPLELRSGGPPPDGIPAIDDPRFQRAGDVGWLEGDEPVLSFELGGDARAYPIQIMTWHEIVNDTVGGLPVALSYCPLCNSAIAYDRRVGERVLDFGTSGLLYRSALVMYDRQTESLWSHFTGQAVAGVLTGEEVGVYPVATVSWSDFRAAHPDGWVLSRETGFSRDYGRNPYPGYDDVDTSPFLFEGEVDGRLAAMERVLGIERAGEAVAIRMGPLLEAKVIAVEVGGEQLVVWAKPGTASALDAPSVAGGRDVGATGVFHPVVDGRALTFAAEGAPVVDEQTGSQWDVLGRAVSGPLAGSQLQAVPHVDTFWFAWAAYLPDSRIIGG